MTVNLEQTYRTKGMQRGALGHISRTLSGTLTVDDKGWSLDGGLGAKDDNYDFDPKEWGKRSIEGEVSTRVGARLKGKNFRIIFKGSKPMNKRRTWE